MFSSSNRFFVYSLFIFSTFSIAGSEASIMALYVLAIIRITKKNAVLSSEMLPLFSGILLFMGITVLSGILNEYKVDHLMALRTNWRLLLPFALMFALEDVDVEKLIKTFFCFLCIISVYGLIQYFTGADWLRAPEHRNPSPYLLAGEGSSFNIFHAKGNFTHHLTYGGMLVLCFPPFAALSVCKGLSTRFRITLASGALLMFLAIIASLGRSVWLGALLALAVLLFWLSRKLFFAGFAIAGILFVLLVSQITLHSPEPESPENTTPSSSSSTEKKVQNSALDAVGKRFSSAFSLGANRDRLLMWKSALAAIADHPLLGIGYDKDQEVMTPYRDAIVEKTKHQFLNKAGVGVHNLYLQTWLNYGLFGLLSYLAIWVLFLRMLVKYLQKSVCFSYSNAWLWGSMAGVAGFMLAGVFENNFRDGEVQTALLMIVGLALHWVRNQEKHSP